MLCAGEEAACLAIAGPADRPKAVTMPSVIAAVRIPGFVMRPSFGCCLRETRNILKQHLGILVPVLSLKDTLGASRTDHQKPLRTKCRMSSRLHKAIRLLHRRGCLTR